MLRRLAIMIMLALCASTCAYAGDNYTLTAPERLNITKAGWNATEGITASSQRIKLTVTASSDWKLTSEHGDTIGYYFAATDGGARITSWDFSIEELNAPGGTHKAFGAVFIRQTWRRHGQVTTRQT